MLMIPAFWTRVIILVDAHPTPLSMIKSQVAWMRDLPLDVAITRRVALRTLDHELRRSWQSSLLSCTGVKRSVLTCH
jgi:hypothetical protein